MKKFINIFQISCAVGIISFISAYGSEQTIKPGNTIHITVLGYPELSMAVVVHQDGSTDYPLLSNVPIDGMTEIQLQEFLQPILARIVERPKTFISIAEYLQIGFSVEGQVNNPGSFVESGPLSLQGALAKAGGNTELADLRYVKILRRDYESQREIKVDMFQYMMENNTATTPEILDGDLIFVPMLNSDSMVRVLGMVNKPGSFVPVKNENIADLIYMAGGPNKDGNMNKITLISTENGKRVVEKIKLRKLLNQGLTGQIKTARPGDIIIVSEYN